jgi:chemotaxis protein methyltransferase CheR
MNDRHFKTLSDAFQFSWSGYLKVRKGVKKRIPRHMRVLDCRRFDQYPRLLAADLEARNECRRLLSVSSSRLFRDSGVWQVI